MKFALHAVGCGSTARPEVLGEVARKAESLGFESVWIPEHLLVPLEIERAVIGEGEFALRHGMRIRTDDGEEIGQVEGVILDDEGCILALALLDEDGEAILFSAIDTIDDDAGELIIAMSDEDEDEDEEE